MSSDYLKVGGQGSKMCFLVGFIDTTKPPSRLEPVRLDPKPEAEAARRLR